MSNDSHLILFGLGVQFMECYSQLVLSLGREPDFLCDNAPEKWGKQFFGKTCIPPGDLAGLGKDTTVVITIRKYEDVFCQLAEMGITNILVACFDQGYDIVHGIKPLGSEHHAYPEKPFVSPVKGKWTLVTGASRGIGREIALAMAGLGSNIIAHSRELDHTKEIIDECRFLGVQARSVAADLGNEAELEGMLDELENTFPPIDIVFNNAGISLPCRSGIWNISSDDYQKHYMVNTIAPVRICYRLVPGMVQRRYGRVVNITSTIQKRPAEMAYACSKAALSKFVHDMAPSIEGTGVMMSLVCPGYVRSDMGGTNAPRPVQSVIPGVLLGAVMDGDVNGRFFIAQDYAGLGLPAAIWRAKFYYNQED